MAWQDEAKTFQEHKLGFRGLLECASGLMLSTRQRNSANTTNAYIIDLLTSARKSFHPFPQNSKPMIIRTSAASCRLVLRYRNLFQFYYLLNNPTNNNVHEAAAECMSRQKTETDMLCRAERENFRRSFQHIFRRFLE